MEGFCGRAIFSMWDKGKYKVSIHNKGEKDVNVLRFGNEGSGLQSILRLNWKPNQLIEFEIEGEYDYRNTRGWIVQCRITIHKRTYVMSTFRRSGFDDILKHFQFTSFIEDFHRGVGADGCLYERAAQLHLPKIEYKNKKGQTSTLYLDTAEFTIDPNPKCRRCKDWTCASLTGQYFWLKTGGSRIKGRTRKVCSANKILNMDLSKPYSTAILNPIKYCIKESSFQK